MSKTLYASQVIRQGVLFATLIGSFALANAQKYEITPLFGARYGGTLKLEQQGVSPNAHAHMEDSFVYGIAGGIRFDEEDCEACALLEFRWMRQSTHLSLSQNPLLPPSATPPAFHPAITLDHFLGDFTHEWTIQEAGGIKPFVLASLGAARMSTPESSSTRFVFGIGTGLKVFPKPHWGFRVQIEYLPMVMHAEVQRIVCTTGCIVALSGGLMNQFEVSVGPTVRF